MNKLTLFVNKQKTVFFDANITYSLQNLAHTFSCKIKPMSITSPESIMFKLNDTAIFTGQIDIVKDITSSDKTIIISGRSATANMINSTIKIDAIYNQNFYQILTIIAGQFNLKVINKVKEKLPEIPEFQISGESPVSNLAQIAKQQNLIIYEDNGSIVIERPAQFEIKNIALKEGENIKEVAIIKNFSNLFYKYEVQGLFSDAEATYINKAINKTRIKTILSDKLHDEESCKARAKYENNIAIAKGLTFTGKIPGLHKELTGKTLNKLIKAQAKNFKEILLVKQITLKVTAQTQHTQISLFRPFGEANA